MQAKVIGYVALISSSSLVDAIFVEVCKWCVFGRLLSCRILMAYLPKCAGRMWVLLSKRFVYEISSRAPCFSFFFAVCVRVTSISFSVWQPFTITDFLGLDFHKYLQLCFFFAL